MTCSVEDCDRPPYRSGFCRGHYERHREGRVVGGELQPRGRPKSVAFWDAVFDLLDLPATDDRGWRLGRKRVEIAARRAFGHRRTE